MAFLKKINDSNEVEKVDLPIITGNRVEESVIESGLNSLDQKKKKLILGFIFISLLLVGIVSVYSFFKWNHGSSDSESLLQKSGLTKELNPEDVIDTELEASLNAGEKTVASPINGVLYTAKRAEIWQKRRPLAVVIENHVASRPPYGLKDAEVVYEAVAEGGITRFVAVFLANQAKRLEPIRSVRNYFIDWAGDYNAIIVHHGGASSNQERTDALGNIDKLKLASLDCMTGENLCPRDETRYAPHNSMSDTVHLWQEATNRNFNDPVKIDEWKFKEDAPSAERPVSQKISYNFWNEADYLVRWEYDSTSNLYKRFNGNLLTDAHVDANYNEQLAFKTVIIQEMGQEVVDDGTPYPHLVFETIGTGKATILMDGKQYQANWEKTERTARVKFFEVGTGAEFVFTRGPIWISVIPVGTLLTVTQ